MRFKNWACLFGGIAPILRIDVELLYLHWVLFACRNPSDVQVDSQAIRMSFPLVLRRPCYKLDIFVSSMSCDS